MKRCKACTTRAAGAVECTLLDEHEGAHEGETVENGVRLRVVWRDPNAPYVEAIEVAPSMTPPLPPAPPLPPFEELPPEFVPERPTRPDVAIVRGKSIASHCACGTEHTGDDRELRVGSAGMPLIATALGELEPDPRFSWARVCLGCGAVYCRIWSGQPLAAERRSCTCPLSQRQRRDFMHDAGCPGASSPSP